MSAKKNIFFVLVALLVFSSPINAGILSNQARLLETSKVFTVSEMDTDSEEEQSITSIREFDGFVLKGNESNSSSFQSLQNQKKHLVINLAVLSTRTFTAYYSTYCQCRINSIQDSPYYIAYHRLII
jgi:hypothetical protein